MYFFKFSENAKSNTSMLDRTFTPKVYYAELHEKMTDLFTKLMPVYTAPSVEQNSLTTSWDLNKQNAWHLYKEISTAVVLYYLRKENLNIFELYALLGDCRHIIAVELQQGTEEERSRLGKARKLEANTDYMVFMTPVAPDGPYQSFIPKLVYLYNENPKFNNISDYKIKIADVCVSELVFNINEDSPEKSSFVLCHCEPHKNNFGVLARKLEDEFQLFLKYKNPDEILNSTAKLLYYFILATPFQRGSAAATEMLGGVLLASKGFHFEYKSQNKMTMDFDVLFSKDIDDFITMFRKNFVLKEYKNPLDNLPSDPCHIM